MPTRALTLPSLPFDKPPILTSEGPSSNVQRASGVGPLEWLGQRFVEIRDEGQDFLAQILHGRKVASLDHAPHQDAEPNLDLIQPRRMFRHIHKTDAMRLVLQKLPPGRHGLQYASFLL